MVELVVGRAQTGLKFNPNGGVVAATRGRLPPEKGLPAENGPGEGLGALNGGREATAGAREAEDRGGGANKDPQLAAMWPKRKEFQGRTLKRDPACFEA